MVDSHKSSNFKILSQRPSPHYLGGYLRYIPNAITFGRILLSVIILSSLLVGKYRMAFYLFIVAGISDALDGFLARRYHWFSRLGSIIDPIADKLLLLSSLIALSYGGHIPAWLVILIVCRDLWVISGAITYHYWIGQFELSPPFLSKLNTFFQLVLVFCILFNLSFVPVPDLLIQTMLVLVFLANMASWISYTWVWGRRAIHAVAQRRQS